VRFRRHGLEGLLDAQPPHENELRPVVGHCRRDIRGNLAGVDIIAVGCPAAEVGNLVSQLDGRPGEVEDGKAEVACPGESVLGLVDVLGMLSVEVHTLEADCEDLVPGEMPRALATTDDLEGDLMSGFHDIPLSHGLIHRPSARIRFLQ